MEEKDIKSYKERIKEALDKLPSDEELLKTMQEPLEWYKEEPWVYNNKSN